MGLRVDLARWVSGDVDRVL